MNEDEIQSVSLEECENYEEMRIQSNAYVYVMVCFKNNTRKNSRCPCIK